MNTHTSRFFSESLGLLPWAEKKTIGVEATKVGLNFQNWDKKLNYGGLFLWLTFR